MQTFKAASKLKIIFFLVLPKKLILFLWHCYVCVEKSVPSI